MTALDKAREAGYTDDEIYDYLAKKFPEKANNIVKARQHGYSIDEVYPRLEKKGELFNQPEKKSSSVGSEMSPQESASRYAGSTGIGLANITRYGLFTNALQALGAGEALSGFQEFLDDLPKYKKLYPNVDWDAAAAKYLANIAPAIQSVPTPSRIAEVVEEKTGIPITPKTGGQKAIQLASEIAGLKPGNVAGKIGAGLKGATVNQIMEQFNVPEPIANALALYYGFHEKTPSVKIPEEKIATENLFKATPESGKAIREIIRGPEEPIEGMPTNIKPGTVLPTLESPYDLQSRAIEEIKKGHEQKLALQQEEGLSPEQKIIKETFKETPESLEKRNISLRGTGLQIRPILPARQIPLTEEVGNIISRDEFINSRQGGQGIVNEVRALDRAAYKKVNDLYQSSREANRLVEEIQPELSRMLTTRLEYLEDIPDPSTMQRRLMRSLKNIIREIGTEDSGFLPINNQRLIDQIQSLRNEIDYNFEHGNAANIFRPVIEDLTKAVEKSAQMNKNALLAWNEARTAYKNWAEMFDNPYIRPLRDKKNLDFSKIYRGAQDIDEYLVLRDILNGTEKGNLYSRALARSIAEKKLSPFFKGNKVSLGKEFDKELRELLPVLGEKRLQEIKNIASKKRNRTFINKTVKIKKEKPTLKFESEKDIEKALNSREGIKELKKELNPKTFDKLAENKVLEILKSERYHPEKLKGSDLLKIVNNKVKREILIQLLGKNQFRELASISNKYKSKILTTELVKDIASYVLGKGAEFTILGKIFKEIYRHAL